MAGFVNHSLSSQSALLQFSSRPALPLPRRLLPLPLSARSPASASLVSRSSRRSFVIKSAVPDSAGGEIGGGGDAGGGSGGGSGGSGGGDRDDKSDPEDGEESNKTAGGMSMSQKITLGYAALVGLGGLMGYLKSGSQKSLGAGGGSALLLYFVYTQLPLRPAFASSIGLGLSAALLVVMGSRFRKSGKIFPAGVVSLFSLVMVGGYAHGIMRGLHA